MSAGSWLRARDPGGLAFARAVRVTIVAPSLFAIALEVFHEPATATTAAFGAVSALVFSDFGGPVVERVRAYLLLGAAGAALLALGTLASGSTAWSVPITFGVAAAARFSGNFGPRWAAAVSPLILAVVLGALVPAPAVAIPDRVLGWAVALVVSAIASVVILPTRTSTRVSGISADAATALAALLRIALDEPDTTARADARATLGRVTLSLRTASLMPIRPGGPGAVAMARRQVVDRLTRIARMLDVAFREPSVAVSPEMRAIGDAAATVLDVSALVMLERAPVSDLVAALSVRDQLRTEVFDEIERSIETHEDPATVLARVDAGFMARAGAWHAETVGHNVAYLAGAPAPVSEDERIADVPETSFRAAIERLDEFVDVHARPSSVWFRDAARAGVALAAAVFVARELGVDHAFWVALATLSVLRSSAMATGQTAVAAAIGTGIGFGVSSGVLAVVGLDRTALWTALVIGMFAVGYLPQVGGFSAGQAAFTFLVIALFNLLAPIGWHAGLTRVEDIAIGVIVSTVVAMLFWPRRLEPLVAQLVAGLSSAVGALLTHSVNLVPSDVWRSARRDVTIAEARTRAAMVEFLVQQRSAPQIVEPWIARLGVASHARSASDAIVRLDALFPVPADAADSALGPALRPSAAAVGNALGSVLGPPAELTAATLAHETREAALAAIADASPATGPVVRDLLTRDWLIAVAEMLETRP